MSLRNNLVEVQDNSEWASGRIDATNRCHCQKVLKNAHLAGGSLRLASPLAGVGSVLVVLLQLYIYSGSDYDMEIEGLITLLVTFGTIRQHLGL